MMGGTFRLAFALALAAAIPAAAIIDCSKIPEEPPLTCSKTPEEPPLKEPPVIEATCNGKACQPGQPGAINTTFCLKIREQCVPGSEKPLKLRTYLYPDPANPEKWIYGFPGPTLKLRKSFPPDGKGNPGSKGDTLAILLDNQLPDDRRVDANGHPVCNSACPATVTCPDRSKLPNPSEKCGGKSADPLCCCWVNANQHLPDCMHGDNTTNLHLHGSHISPQSPQDYVLLELHPAANKGKELHRMTARSNVQDSQFQYKTDPFPLNQSEGTHWYHPHKHGSVSLQVANGMAGALIILGPFDQWLNDYYAKQNTKLTEKILILQQIQQDTNLFKGGGSPPQILINGQLKPKLTVQAGEVQRWRVVNATLQASGQLNITFPAGSQVMQIAQDGVQFAPKTYDDQLLLKDGKTFSLSAGNRADFLVRMPLAPTKVHMTQSVRGNLSARAREKVQLRDQQAKDLSTGDEAEAPILTIEVVAPPQGEANAQAVPEGFPSMKDWPEMPEHLKDIQPNEIEGHQKLVFSMKDHTGAASGAGNPATRFLINDLQYKPDCVNITTKLGTADEWLVENSSDIEHPFHIHTNPFQLVELWGTVGEQLTSIKYDPPIWFDTIAIPKPAVRTAYSGPGVVATESQAKERCPALCKNENGVWNEKWKSGWMEGSRLICDCTFNGYVKLLHRYLDFTGEYVLHCHFLGHEDRGMMFGVQTVCKGDPAKFGKAKADGSPECVSGNLIDSVQRCSDTPVTASSSHSH